MLVLLWFSIFNGAQTKTSVQRICQQQTIRLAHLETLFLLNQVVFAGCLRWELPVNGAETADRGNGNSVLFCDDLSDSAPKDPEDYRR